MTEKEKIESWMRRAQNVIEGKRLHLQAGDSRAAQRKERVHRSREEIQRLDSLIKIYYEGMGWMPSKIALELGIERGWVSQRVYQNKLRQKKKSPDDAANITRGDT